MLGGAVCRKPVPALYSPVRLEEGLLMFACRIMRLITTLGLLAFATSVSTGGKHDSSTKQLTAAQCEQLLKQLVNSGKRPFTEDYVLDLPKGASETSLWRKQKRIAAAYDE